MKAGDAFIRAKGAFRTKDHHVRSDWLIQKVGCRVARFESKIDSIKLEAARFTARAPGRPKCVVDRAEGRRHHEKTDRF